MIRHIHRGTGGRSQANRTLPRVGPNPTPILLRLSVVLSALAGFGLGLTLLLSIALGRASAIPFAALTQAHGQVQALGFVGLFIVGAASQLLPGFLATPLRRRREMVIGGFVAAGGLLARAIGQPLGFGIVRDLTLGFSALAVSAGFALCLYALGDLPRRSLQPPEPWRRLAEAGFGFLASSLLVNAVAVATLIGGHEVVPPLLDAALIELELWGFGGMVALAVAWKVLPRFLILPPPNRTLLRSGSVLYGLGVALSAGVQLFLATPPAAWMGLAVLLAAWFKVVGVIGFLVGLRLYEPPTRPSGAPQVTEPARRWLRLAFGWLAVAALVGAAWSTYDALRSVDPTLFALGASRHALGQGFFLTLIVALGARILPGFSAWAIGHPRFVSGVVTTLTVGAIARVIGEAGLALSVSGAAPIAALGGSVGTLGFLAFPLCLLKYLP